MCHSSCHTHLFPIMNCNPFSARLSAMAGPRPVVFSGPSGAGKSTLLKKLMEEYNSVFGFSVSRKCACLCPRNQNIQPGFCSVMKAALDLIREGNSNIFCPLRYDEKSSTWRRERQRYSIPLSRLRQHLTTLWGENLEPPLISVYSAKEAGNGCSDLLKHAT